MSEKESNNDNNDLKKIDIDLGKINEFFKQLEEYKNLITLLEEFLDLLDEKINPMYELAKKTENVLGKCLYTVSIFKHAKNLVPLLQKMKEDKEKDGSFI